MTSASHFPRHLCLVRLSALGDVVMTLALVREIQRQWPGTRLTWICGAALFPVLAPLEREGVRLFPLEKPRGPGDYWALRKRLQGTEFDALFAIQASWRANFIYPLVNAKRKIGYSRDRAKDGHRWFVNESIPPAEPHLIDGFFQFGEHLGLRRPASPLFRLPVDPEALASVAPLLPPGGFLAVNLCSSKAERDWPADRCAVAVNHVWKRHSLPAVFIGGPAPRERAFVEAVKAKLTGAHVDLVGKTSVLQMIATLSCARGLLSPDTGAVHIARALGVPVCGLYAVAPASRTGPYRALEFCVDKFDEAVCTLANKDPSSIPWSTRVHLPGAMELILVDEVKLKLDLLLDAGVQRPGSPNE